MLNGFTAYGPGAAGVGSVVLPMDRRAYTSSLVGRWGQVFPLE